MSALGVQAPAVGKETGGEEMSRDECLQQHLRANVTLMFEVRLDVLGTSFVWPQAVHLQRRALLSAGIDPRYKRDLPHAQQNGGLRRSAVRQFFSRIGTYSRRASVLDVKLADRRGQTCSFRGDSTALG